MDGSPLINPLLCIYANQAGFSIARLEAVDEPVGLDGLQLPEEAGLYAKGASSVLESHAYGGLEAPPLSLASSLPLERATAKRLPEQPNLRSDGQLMFGTSDLPLDSLRLTSREAEARPNSGETADKLFSIAQQKAKEMLAEESSSLNRVVPRQGAETLADYKPTKDDVECLAKTQSGQEHLAGANNRFLALLDWGLFCGYTRYSVSALRKWPISCEEDCHFGKLHFSRYRENEAKTREQGYAFMNSVQAMSKEQAQFCSVVAGITACRIEEKCLQYGAICRCGFAIKCLVDCIIIVANDKKKMATAR